MYTIELTAGAAWDAPVTAVHRIRSSFHIADVERRAEALLIDARIAGELPRPTNYRIRDPLGRCVRSSAGAKPVSTFRRAGRTCWA